jgi:PIN domain nuclease of toxin-antitoxin system
MILLDTHIWLWAVQGAPHFKERHRRILDAHRDDGLGISLFSCWKVAMLVRKNRITLPYPPQQWIDIALTYPGIQLIGLTQQILVESTLLPEPFHGDPADRIIVATARAHDMPLFSDDGLILNYPHVKLVH